MALSVRWLPLVAVIVAVLALPSVVGAQSGPEIIDQGVTNDFPAGMEFKVSVTSDSPIEELRLRYTVLPDGTAATGRPDFKPATEVEATFRLAGNNPPVIYLPPGTVIEYYWEATDADGDVATTEEKSFFYDDSRFEWQKVSGEGSTIYYYSGSDGDAQDMHDVAVEQLAALSDLLDTEVPFEVLVWIYEGTDDMKPALQRRSETYESQITTAGVRVASNTVLVLGNASFDTLRHELTHVVTAQAGESALGSLPAWLDEGTAVYGQSDPSGFREAVERAIDDGEVLSVREISAYPGDPDKVNLFYGEGWSLVSFLIDEYGEEQFAQLYAEIKSGKRIESALEAVYGFGQDGLEDEWRAANGLAPRPTEEPGGPDGVSPPENNDGGGTSVAVVVGLALGVMALAVVAGLAGVMLARRV
ncbi:MAG: peptidase MA family metallohydrolase, partial [Dehalococcoidia bacterium]